MTEEERALIIWPDEGTELQRQIRKDIRDAFLHGGGISFGQVRDRVGQQKQSKKKGRK